MSDQLSLFNAMDGNLLSVGEGVFNQSLVMNVLFQEKLLVSETLFFNSHVLAKHIGQMSGHQSLFEAACKQGIVVPALRGVKTLEDAFNNFPKIYGPKYPGVPAMLPFKDRVIAAVDSGIAGGRTIPVQWPNDGISFSESYGELIKKLLQTDDPPAYVNYEVSRGKLFRRIWDKTINWRLDLVTDAIRLTEAKGFKGLQRAELFDLLGKQLGVEHKEDGVGGLDIVSACKDPEDQLAASMFVKWCTQCHHLNQARRFGVSINFPVYSFDQDFILDSILRSPLDAAPTKDKGFRCEVRLPEPAKLAQMRPEDLLAIRSDIGHGYLHALRRWYENPTETNQQSVEITLDRYCEDIRARYQAVHVRPIEVAISSGTTTVDRLNLQSGFEKVYDIVVQAHVPLLHQIFALGRIAYRILKVGQVRSQNQPHAHELEITLAKDAASY
jgi:hypothetical protein